MCNDTLRFCRDSVIYSFSFFFFCGTVRSTRCATWLGRRSSRFDSGTATCKSNKQTTRASSQTFVIDRSIARVWLLFFLRFCRRRPAHLWVKFFSTTNRGPVSLTRVATGYKINSDPPEQAYLLGLLAKIKCSICSYQLNLWYVDKSRHED